LLLPALSDVWVSLVDGFSTGIFQSHTLVTVIESLVGFLLAFGIALPLGYALVKSRLLAITIQPYIAAWQAIPAIAIAPLLILWLGFDLEPVIAICALVVFFPMIISIMLGFQTMEREYLEAAQLDGAAGWSMFSTIELPLALPAIMAAVRAGLTLSITGAIVGEFVRSGDKGLGELALLSKTQYASDAMFATLLVLATLAILYYVLAWGLSRWSERIYG
jgi:NitT/TauT family transport system permease protein